jgi:hypothetical protein
MTQDEIIKMARQAQMPFYWRTGEITYLDKLEAFAKLVAQHEREACADMVNKYIKETDNMEARGCLASVAYDIRARGQA